MILLLGNPRTSLPYPTTGAWLILIVCLGMAICRIIRLCWNMPLANFRQSFNMLTAGITSLPVWASRLGSGCICGIAWLCCTNRVKDVLPLSPYAPSLQFLWQVYQEQCSDWGRRCGFGFLRPAAQSPAPSTIGRVVWYSAFWFRRGFDGGSAPASPHGAAPITWATSARIRAKCVEAERPSRPWSTGKQSGGNSSWSELDLKDAVRKTANCQITSEPLQITEYLLFF